MDETQRQRRCLCAHTPYFHTEEISESGGDRPYPPGRHKSFHRTVTAISPSYWFPRLLLPDGDHNRAQSALTTPVHDKCTGSNFLHKGWETTGSLETRQESQDSPLSAKIDLLSQETSSRHLLKITEGSENTTQVNGCLSNSSIEPQVHIWTSSLGTVLHTLLK